MWIVISSTRTEYDFLVFLNGQDTETCSFHINSTNLHPIEQNLMLVLLIIGRIEYCRYGEVKIYFPAELYMNRSFSTRKTQVDLVIFMRSVGINFRYIIG